jgi:hypothetical protein
MTPATAMSSQTPLDDGPCTEVASGHSTALPKTEPARRRPQRRRLWHLPTQAHELLLALSFTPEWLRREAARTLGQIHKGQCVLRGRDVDVLYGVVHDLVTRNALSEAMHKHLDARHALALRTIASVKDEPALRAAWAQAQIDDGFAAGVPATLWAVLTHPLGEVVQSTVLYDARAWVFDHARRSVGLAVAQRQTDALAQQARQRADELQGRLATQQQQAAEALRQAQADIVRLQGELARAKALALSDRAPEMTVHRAKPCAGPIGPTAPHRIPDQESATASAPEPTARPAHAPAVALVQGDAPAERPNAGLEVAGRRVLCVGGIQHAVSRYRGRIEKLGGRFEHHDGGIEDGIQALDARLGRADVVICQAACINHEAYHRVKRHCDRTGTPCVYLDRPSLSRLDRALAFDQGAQHASR